MSILIRNIEDFKKELEELPYLDVKESVRGLSKGDIYVYKKWRTTTKNRLIDFLTVGGHLLVLRIKPIRSPYMHIRKEYASVYISDTEKLQLSKMIDVLTLVEKYEVSKLPLFDLDHLRELGFKFVVKDEVKK